MADFVATVWIDIDVLDFGEIQKFFDLSDFEGVVEEEVLGGRDLSEDFDWKEEAARNAIDNFVEIVVEEAEEFPEEDTVPMDYVSMQELVFGG